MFWVFVGIVIIESILFAPSIERREQELLAQLKEVTLGKVTWILVTYQGMSGETLVARLFELQQRNPLMLGGAVYRPSGELIGTFGDHPTLGPAELQQAGPHRQGDLYDAIIWSGKERMTDFTILMRHDASSVGSDLWAFVLRTLGVAVIISLFLTLTVWIALNPLVIAPIVRLNRDLLLAGESIAKDRNTPEFSTTDFQRKDELGDVLRAFQHMFGQISDAVAARKRAETALKQSLEKLDQELEKGRKMQQNFLPEQLPEIAGWEVSASMSPARRVAGDFYDFFELPDHNLGVVIGDVCDKGVSAALFMGLFRSLIRIFSGQPSLNDGHHPQWDMHKDRPHSGADDQNDVHTNALGAVQLTNDYVADSHGSEGMFATLFFGVIDTRTGRLSYINGGHEPLLILDLHGKIKASLGPTGTAVGVMQGLPFQINTAIMQPGDLLLGFTDGVVDACTMNGEQFGKERFFQLIQAPSKSARSLVERVKDTLVAFEGGTEQSDDVTLVTVRRTI